MVTAGTGEALPGPAACVVVVVGASRPITGNTGKWAGVGRASEAAVLPLEPIGTTEPAVREGPLLRLCVTCREGLVSATSWLGPPSSRTKSEICNERFTGRPRPIPDGGSTRSMTRSIAGTCWSARGGWCAPTAARPASTDRPSPTSSNTGPPVCLTSWPRTLRGELASASCAPGVHREARP